MQEINKLSRKQITRAAWLITYALASFALSFFWRASNLDFWLCSLSVGIFILAFFKRDLAFYLLLLIRISFDSYGTKELFSLFNISISLNLILGLVLIAITISLLFENKWRWSELKFVWPWLIFLSLISILSFFSVNKFLSFAEVFRLLSFCSIFVYAYFTFSGLKKLTTLAQFIIFSALIPSTLAYWQLFNNQAFFDGDRWRLLGTFVHPNMLAFYLVLAITLSIFVALSLRRGLVMKIPYALLSLYFFIPLLLTYTRAAWLALAFIIFFLGVYRFKSLLLVGIISFFLLYFFVPIFQERTISIFSLGAADSSSWRLNLWEDLIYFIKARPWFGYGPGTAATFIGDNIPRFAVATEPHNDYLRIWLESGIFALLAYLYLYWYLIKHFYQSFKQEKRKRLKTLLLFIIFFILALGGASLSDNIIKDSVLQWTFWSLAGALLANINIKKEVAL